MEKKSASRQLLDCSQGSRCSATSHVFLQEEEELERMTYLEESPDGAFFDEFLPCGSVNAPGHYMVVLNIHASFAEVIWTILELNNAPTVNKRFNRDPLKPMFLRAVVVFGNSKLLHIFLNKINGRKMSDGNILDAMDLKDLLTRLHTVETDLLKLRPEYDQSVSICVINVGTSLENKDILLDKCFEWGTVKNSTVLKDYSGKPTGNILVTFRYFSGAFGAMMGIDMTLIEENLVYATMFGNIQNVLVKLQKMLDRRSLDSIRRNIQ